ncbi:hypothetical protein FFLO_00178 [Filobasidium floriforme]|uniref:Uncharacterized protein n=1 Tax=Filobasidium floriforme TaxID=5210 RepID=A0A8K0NVW9_9TREE|nr:uncharacterized protein HD553DRAFT_307982 [Filobasidium floriforme]KAG7579970.1 hypothetical protein FFLO_00178 [Filobasidium floriforme]KAH8087369.1 hypothetical protein HD553DRAFT_307982 [Filobasidium floriforme]
MRSQNIIAYLEGHWEGIPLGGLCERQYGKDQLVTYDLDSKTARKLCEYFETEEYKIHPPTPGFHGQQKAALCELIVLKEAATWLMIRAEAAKARAKPVTVLESDAYRGFDNKFTSDGLTWMQAESEAMEREMMGRAEKLTAGDSSAQLERSIADSCTGSILTDHKPIDGLKRHDSFFGDDGDVDPLESTTQRGGSTLTAY